MILHPVAAVSLISELSVFKPFTPESFLQLIAIAFLLFLSGFFSSSEVAFFMLSPSQLAEIRQKPKHGANAVILHLLSNPKRLLATLLISNSLVNIAIVILSTVVISNSFDFSHHPVAGYLLQVLVVTFLIVLLGEVLPKVYATHRSDTMVHLVAYPVFILDKLLSPLSRLLMGASRFVEKRMVKRGYNVTLDELTHAIDLVSGPGSAPDENKMLKGIVRFGNMEVRQIMKPRIEVAAVDESMPFSDVLALIRQKGYSRMPVYKGEPDRISGMLHIKDLVPFLSEGDTFRWQSLIREACIIPENKKVNNLFRELRDRKNHLAMVVNEHGTFLGIVTLEDIMEEVVGEMSDEFDDDEPFYSRLDDFNFVFDARTPLSDVFRILSLEHLMNDEHAAAAGTLAGLALELTGRIPARGERIAFHQLTLVVEAADKRRVKRIKIILPHPIASDSRP